MGDELFHADRQTVGRDEANSRFRNFVTATTTHKYNVWVEGRICKMLHLVVHKVNAKLWSDNSNVTVNNNINCASFSFVQNARHVLKQFPSASCSCPYQQKCPTKCCSFTNASLTYLLPHLLTYFLTYLHITSLITSFLNSFLTYLLPYLPTYFLNYFLTSLIPSFLIYFLTYFLISFLVSLLPSLLTSLPTYLLHGAESFLRS